MRENINAADLADIGTVSVDKDLPQRERCAEFRRQIRDICHYKCETDKETFSITAVYAKNGTYLEDCLRGMLA